MTLEQYPHIRFILAHMGGYHSWEVPLQGIELAKHYPNVWLETSVVTVKFIERALKQVGPDRIIFGSDGPEQDSRVEIYKIKLLQLPPADEAKILGGNIQKLLPNGST